MHRRERWYHQLDNNRLVRPFDWGLSYIVDHVNGDDPRELFRKHTARVMQASEDFYALPPITDYRLEGDQLTWTSAITTPSPENNIARAQVLSRKEQKRPATAQCSGRAAAVERATGKSRRSLPDLQLDRHVGAATDASVSSATKARRDRTRRSSRQHEYRSHDSIDETGGAGHARGGALVEERGVRARGHSRHQRRLVYRVSCVCARAGSQCGCFQSRFRLCGGCGLARTLDGARARGVCGSLNAGRAAHLLGADQPAAVYAARGADGSPADAFHHRALRSHVSDRSLSRSDRRSASPQTSTRHRLASLRPLHHRRAPLESDRRLEDRDVLQKAISNRSPRVNPSANQRHLLFC